MRGEEVKWQVPEGALPAGISMGLLSFVLAR